MSSSKFSYPLSLFYIKYNNSLMHTDSTLYNVIKSFFFSVIKPSHITFIVLEKHESAGGLHREEDSYLRII